jgi:hypothetical protein
MGRTSATHMEPGAVEWREIFKLLILRSGRHQAGCRLSLSRVMRQTSPAQHHGYADISRLCPSSEGCAAVVLANLQDLDGRLLEQDDGRQANVARARDYDFDAHEYEHGLKLAIAVESAPPAAPVARTAASALMALATAVSTSLNNIIVVRHVTRHPPPRHPPVGVCMDTYGCPELDPCNYGVVLTCC